MESLIQATQLLQVLSGGNLSNEISFLVPHFCDYSVQSLMIVSSKHLTQLLLSMLHGDKFDLEVSLHFSVESASYFVQF